MSHADREFWNLSKYNDILDIFLFLLGVIPFIPLGDVFESAVGGVFDLLLGFWFYKDKRIGKKVFFVFFLECIDLLDLFVRTLVDIFGWLELIPFWFLFFRKVIQDPESFPPKTDINAPQKATPIIETPISICPECGASINEKLSICELCGSNIKEHVESTKESIQFKLNTLREMLDSGFITTEEYESKRAELLEKVVDFLK